MTAVRNHVAVPFFDRVPTRVKAILLTTFDNIVDLGHSQKEAYYFFGNGAKKLNVEGPTFAEFSDWYGRVKNGLIERPHPSEVLFDINTAEVRPYDPRPKGPEERFFRSVKQPLAAACVVDTAAADLSRLEHARAIVVAAHRLFEVKLAAGYSPLSIPVDDVIVQEALREVLSAEASATVMDADVHMTPGNKLVDLLLGEGDDDIDAKLVDCLTIDMQAEICALLVKRMAKEGGGHLTEEALIQAMDEFLGTQS